MAKRPVKKAAPKRTAKTAAKRTSKPAAPALAVRKFRFNGGFPTAPDLSHVEIREDGAARLVRKGVKDEKWIPAPAEGEPDQRPYTPEQVERHVINGHWEEL